GPGITFTLIDRIQAGVPMTILARNSIGTWLHIQREDDDGEVIENGWVISGYLNLLPDLHFEDVLVETGVGDADADSDMSQLHDLYIVPVIPTISDAMRDLYAHGRELRNYPYVITKVGDSVTADSLYLQPMSRRDNVLGPYDYLAGAMRYFGASTSVESMAARVGMTTLTVFDPTWAPEPTCEPRETPLDCEYRRKRPSISLIMFGPNDLLRMDDDHFEEQIRKIVERSIELGIIPVLSTFSYDPGMGLWLQSVNFNRRLATIAAEYEVPIINLWLAARALPDYGLEIDHIHMKHWGFEFLKFNSGNVAFSGASLRNLLTIRTLDEIRNTVILPAEAADDAA
ncbi:MAG: GDSL-type esterase/lipase family protein, partial [Chloroflexota bacterium]